MYNRKNEKQKDRHVNQKMLVCIRSNENQPSIKEIQQKTYKESIKHGLSTISLVDYHVAYFSQETINVQTWLAWVCGELEPAMCAGKEK